MCLKAASSLPKNSAKKKNRLLQSRNASDQNLPVDMFPWSTFNLIGLLLLISFHYYLHPCNHCGTSFSTFSALYLSTRCELNHVTIQGGFGAVCFSLRCGKTQSKRLIGSLNFKSFTVERNFWLWVENGATVELLSISSSEAVSAAVGATKAVITFDLWIVLALFFCVKCKGQTAHLTASFSVKKKQNNNNNKKKCIYPTVGKFT